MSDGSLPGSENPTQSALEQLLDYLSDRVPPALVAEDVHQILSSAPGSVVDGIFRWTVEQQDASPGGLAVSHLLYHALKKLQLLVELGGLNDVEDYEGRLRGLVEAVWRRCPEGDKPQLQARLRHLHDASATLGKTVELLHRTSEDEGPPAAAEPIVEEALPASENDVETGGPPPPEEPDPSPAAPGPEVLEPTVSSAVREADRVVARQLLLRRRLKAPPAPVTEEQRSAVASELVQSATEAALDVAELQEVLVELERQGFGKMTPDRLIKLLTDRLPDWSAGSSRQRAEAGLPSLGAVERMTRMMEGSEDEAIHLGHIFEAGIQHFSEESLGRACTVFSLADRMLSQSRLPDEMKGKVRAAAQQKLDLTVFRELAKDGGAHRSLSEILDYFPAYRVDALLQRLLRDAQRQRRHVILGMLRVHGEEAREAAVARLLQATTDAEQQLPWYGTRNLIYLLRQIRPPGEVSEQELQAVLNFAGLHNPAPVVREVHLYLGRMTHPMAVGVLIDNLGELTDLRSRRRRHHADYEEIVLQLNLVLGQLIASPSPEARLEAVRFILGQNFWQELYDEMLGKLGARNLTREPAVVEALVDGIRGRLPGGALAQRLRTMLQPRREEILGALIRSLRSTPLPEVEAALRTVDESEVSDQLRRLAVQTIRELEQRALEAQSGPELAGNLEVFGLPNLLQNLEQTEASGVLELKSEDGKRSGLLRLFGGQLVHCEAEKLSGVDAFHLLLQRPFASRFSFVSDEEPPPPAKPPRPVTPLMLEAMRRYDEFQRLQAVVPDGPRIVATEVKPSIPHGEQDAELVRDLWQVVRRGGSALLCEDQVRAEPYRVRRLLVHWVEEGACELQFA